MGFTATETFIPEHRKQEELILTTGVVKREESCFMANMDSLG